MGTIAQLAAVPALVLALGTPGGSRLVVLETAAALPDRTQRAVVQGLEEALDASKRQALTMGLSWTRLHSAVVAGDMMIVQVVAADAPGTARALSEQEEPSDAIA
jgi:hypothetical protein